ncbi:core-2/I-Branching enzyme [Mucilaginibacter gracilis]|uniref:Peptide O-xylosyltransferase n=1 Tax=Mucilaginibacter gracilis TaxID=423350 RepID=A0A495J9A5_9SPHI|nr:beta-1,6-N-acetylglucosaminyltransferase [Mucilaginibacter gracilis]RKR85487.1 core-2/I-Branching enzyme [Mucilaginibacter gracilis]
MTKIAHLILAHNNPVQLSRLVSRLTHPDADIYIHLDGKADEGPFNFLLNTPNVYFIKSRVKVYWGAYSIVQATLNGFTQILASSKKYDYINLLSGNDYPIKSTRQIHEFFHHHPDRIFMEYLTEDSDWWKQIKTRVTEYHLTDYHFPASYYAQVLMNKVWPKRKMPENIVFIGRSQWLTITPASAQYIVDYLRDNPKIQRFFRLSWGADEIAIQTILYNSPFKNKIENNNYRYIDWSEQKASPKTLTMADADKLIASPCLFARKFDLEKAPDIFNYLDSTFS